MAAFVLDNIALKSIPLRSFRENSFLLSSRKHYLGVSDGSV